MAEQAVPVQAVRFDPKGQDGIPAFYAQRVSASGFPIVASANVNPYALKEAVRPGNSIRGQAFPLPCQLRNQDIFKHREVWD